tara:strand:- start:156 stop:479 length:324 start_codon:yes stop_codon:yes gene_type:complete
MPVILSKSSRKEKKYMIKHDNKTIHFGQAGARDYTEINKKSSQFYLPNKEDREKVKKAYKSRHAKDPINKPYTAGALSMHLLWNKPTLSASIKDYERRFGIDVVNRS